MSTDQRKELLDAIASTGVLPFQSQVVDTPWSPFIDVPELYRETKQGIHRMVENCHRAEAVRCLTIVAPSGYGKTHLLAWTRKWLEDEKNAVFIYVPPFSDERFSFSQHVMHSVLKALWLQSRSQKTAFEQAVRMFLATCYNELVTNTSNKDLKKVLGIRVSFWRSLLGWPKNRFKINLEREQDHFAPLQRAFQKRAFFERVYHQFEKTVEYVATQGVGLDRDTFIAASLLTCGSEYQRLKAKRWFLGELTIPADLDSIHLDRPCRGIEKIQNGLFTLSNLIGKNFCVTFDQMERTTNVIKNDSQAKNDMEHFIQPLTTVPRCCLLFSFEQSIWMTVGETFSKHLLRRMTQGGGPHTLDVLDSSSAENLISKRMDATVWQELKQTRSPDIEDYFPFTKVDIDNLLERPGGEELGAFLQNANQRYSELLQPVAPPACPIRLSSLEPEEVISHESTPILIKGEKLPFEVRVSFDGHPSPSPAVCRPDLGEIDVTTLPNLLHENEETRDVEVKVQDPAHPENVASLNLRVISSEVPRPFRKYLDGKRLQEVRKEKGWSQAKVAAEIGTYQVRISQLENENWSTATDDIYVELAKLYKRPLSYFRKQKANEE